MADSLVQCARAAGAVQARCGLERAACWFAWLAGPLSIPTSIAISIPHWVPSLTHSCFPAQPFHRHPDAHAQPFDGARQGANLITTGGAGNVIFKVAGAQMLGDGDQLVDRTGQLLAQVPGHA